MKINKSGLMTGFIILSLCSISGCNHTYSASKGETASSGTIVEHSSEEKTPTNSEKKKNKKNEKEVEFMSSWQEKSVALPKLQNVTRHNTSIMDGLSITTCLTGFSYNEEKIMNAVINTPFIVDNYQITKRNTEEIKGNYNLSLGEQRQYILTDSIAGYPDEIVASSMVSDFEVSFVRDTAKTENYKGFYVSINKMTMTKNRQEEIYDFLSEIVNADIAAYLVFHPDADGKTVEGEDIGKFELSDSVYIGNTNYIMKRQLDSGTKSIYFECMLDDEEVNENTYKYYDGGYVSKYPYLEYKLTDIFAEETVGDLNLDKISTFGSKYMSSIISDYTYTNLKNAKIDVIQMNNGTNIYNVDVSVVASSNNMPSLSCPNLEINYIVTEENGELSMIYIGVDGDTGFREEYVADSEDAEDTETTEKVLAGVLHESLLEQIKILFPQYKNEKFEHIYGQLDCEYEKKLKVGEYNLDAKITLNSSLNTEDARGIFHLEASGYGNGQQK